MQTLETKIFVIWRFHCLAILKIAVVRADSLVDAQQNVVWFLE